VPDQTHHRGNPVLYIFAISHYCEKARWALDHYDIAYHLRPVMPGMNRGIAKKLGGTGGSLPFLKTADGFVGGSPAIIDWGENNRKPGRPRLAGTDEAATRAVEHRIDDVIGVHVRRFYYSDALLTDPASVRPIFSRDLPLFQKAAVTLGWSKIVPLMIKGMDLGPDQGAASGKILEAELDWLDAMLADGRRYLTSDHLTRADIAAASLLAPLVNPAEHPTYGTLSLPPTFAARIAAWESRPILRWVRDVYARDRRVPYP
jgi:glutathione S-transferase